MESVTLLAVSKTFDANAVAAAHAAGQRLFGENYVQEALAKIAALAELAPRPEWHLIGPVQTNKTRIVAETFDWVHGSVWRVLTHESCVILANHARIRKHIAPVRPHTAGRPRSAP